VKVCHTDHVNPSFGEIPAGSLWEDDSPYVDDEHFADVVDVEIVAEPAPRKSASRRKTEEG